MSTLADTIALLRAGKTVTRTELLDVLDAADGLAAQEFLVEAGLRALERAESQTLATIFDAKAKWSAETFGPHQRAAGVIAHIRKELLEIEAAPTDLVEWIDVVMIAMDGAWRCAGADGATFAAAFAAKHEKNLARTWPDWRTASPDAPIEHVRTLDEKLAVAVAFAKPPEPTLADVTRERDEALAETARWVARVKLLEGRIAKATRSLAAFEGSPTNGYHHPEHKR